MRLNDLAVYLKHSNFVSLCVVYIWISVLCSCASVVYCQNLSSNDAVNAPAMALRTNSSQSASATAGGIHNSVPPLLPITTTTAEAAAAAAAAAKTTTTPTMPTVRPPSLIATVTSQMHRPRDQERSQQKSQPLQKPQQRAKLPSAKGMRPVHGKYIKLFTRRFAGFDFIFQFINLFRGFSFQFHSFIIIIVFTFFSLLAKPLSCILYLCHTMSSLSPYVRMYVNRSGSNSFRQQESFLPAVNTEHVNDLNFFVSVYSVNLSIYRRYVSRIISM